ncbi:MAG: RNA 2',3'-cyclic phosphodiesterase [Candidatus Thermoplasmatota archaeon]|nr:RNA 2',3'-cyclic phosphodiesterase [Candidatus Thermoplasmatota archaeon]
MPRLFVGTPLAHDLDTQPVLDELSGLEGVKKVDPAIYHVTLAFIGDTLDPKVADVEQAIGSLSTDVASHTVKVRGLGAFPKAHKARVLWAGLEGHHLDVLARDVRAALKERKVPHDTRAFHAHLTLARLKRPQDLTGLLHAHKATELGTLDVDAVHLYESHLTPQGPRYTNRLSCTLEEPA